MNTIQDVKSFIIREVQELIKFSIESNRSNFYISLNFTGNVNAITIFITKNEKTNHFATLFLNPSDNESQSLSDWNETLYELIDTHKKLKVLVKKNFKKLENHNASIH